ncbi:CVNH domain-containing protein [Lacibacterium aquatile]|uniref:CVNH domain-containing protein n=1 Tax=Lacibacterium aquatile TaxID=1168082 RepID=A0ABW5DVI8_9PROT
MTLPNVFFGLVALSTLVAGAAFAEPSSFQQSCDRIQLDANDTSVWITAQCRTMRGDFKRTSYELRGIANIDGQLRQERKRETSFQRSCRDISLKWTEKNVQILALCKTMSGAERRTSFTLNDIQNNDGKLMVAR